MDTLNNAHIILNTCPHLTSEEQNNAAAAAEILQNNAMKLTQLQHTY